MAVTTIVYNLFKRNGRNVNALDADTLKLSLHTSAYTPNYDTHEFFSDLTNQIGGSGGYTSGGETITGLTSAVDATGNFAYLDGDDVTWSGLTPSAAFRYGALYDTSDSNRLIMLIDFGGDQDPAGEPFTLTWPSPASGGILKVA